MQITLKDIMYLCLDIDKMNEYLEKLEEMRGTACRDEKAVTGFLTIFGSCMENYVKWLFERKRIGVEDAYEIGTKVGGATNSIIGWLVRGFLTCDEVDFMLLDSVKGLDVEEDIEMLKSEFGEVLGR